MPTYKRIIDTLIKEEKLNEFYGKSSSLPWKGAVKFI